jgi:MFS transporter, DHA1 family, multidrug resistance protein
MNYHENNGTPLNMSRVMLMLILAMLCIIPLLASDIYIPALPSIAHSFNAESVDVQLTLTVYLLGLSLGQLLYGPLSDIWGRKKVLIVGILIFVVASGACSLSMTLPQLIFSRFFQSVGACSGFVLSRAITGDLFNRTEAAKVFTLLFPMVGISSAIMPIIGGYLTDLIGWQACFIFTTGFGLILLLNIILFLKETKKAPLYTDYKIGNRLSEFVTILKTPSFLGYTAIVSSAYAAYFIYIAESPFLFFAYDLTAHQIGYLYIGLSVFYVIGNLSGRRLINYCSINQAIIIGIALFLIGSISMVGLSIIGIVNPYGIIIPMCVLTAGNGFLFPLGTASAVSLFPNSTGTASGLMGFLQLSTASLGVWLIGHISHDQLLPISMVILCIALLGSFSFYLLIFKEVTANGQI